MSIDDRVIDEVSRATDIVQVIAGYIPIKKAGANYKALCPFHREKTPSFMISPQKQIYHCFGCGAGGNVFSFVMKYENMTFPETLRHLAQKAGIRIPEERKFSKEKVSKKRVVSEIYSAACEYYRTNYVNDIKGKPARDYFEAKRGFSRQVCSFFKIGYASFDSRGLLNYLRKKGFQEDIIRRSGLVISPASGQPYDFFRGKVIFPIFNIKDKIIAFGGRTLGKEEPKYINSPETEYFRKRYELYGLNFARREIHQSARTVIIVEGYVDVMSLFQYGIKNVVAPLGTALTSEHVRLVKRYADRALMIFDSDTAGINASLRSLDIFLEESFSAEIITLPRGYDPDSFIREKGRDEFIQMFDKAEDVFDFKLNILLKKYDTSDSHGLVQLTNEMIDTLRLVKNTILLDRYIKKLSTRLGIHETSVRRELNKSMKRSHQQGRAGEVGGASGQHKDPYRYHKEELNLLHIIISEPVLLETAFSLINADEFERNDAREIFLLIKHLFNNGQRDLNFNMLANRIENEETKAALSVLPFLIIDEETKEEALSNRIREIKLKKYDKQLKEIHGKIREAESKHDDRRCLELQYMQMTIQREKQTLKNKGSMVLP